MAAAMEMLIFAAIILNRRNTLFENVVKFFAMAAALSTHNNVIESMWSRYQARPSIGVLAPP